MFLIKASYRIYSCGAFFRWKNMRYGIEKTDKAGVYIGSFKEFIGKGYRENLAREGKDMSVVLDTYKKGIRIGRVEGRTEGINIGRSEGIDIGRSEGIDIGRNEGIDIGRTQGISIGRVESLRIVAKNMKEQGFETDIIIKTTGLDKEEIELL